MHYVIDGYNLLYAVGRLQPGRGNLEAARLDLLRLLQGRFANRPDEITVVFDALKSTAPRKQRQDYQGIAVYFTRSEEADDVIEALIRASAAPLQLTVVSNDRRLKEAARRKGCPVVEGVTFWASLLEPPEQRAPPATPPERPAVSSADVEHWTREFRDLDKDAAFKELFDDGFGD